MGGRGCGHADIVSNLSVLVANRLRATSDLGDVVDAWVRCGPADPTAGMISRPDLVVVWGEPATWGGYENVLTNPRAVVEVLNPATVGFIQSEQMHRLGRWAPTLTDYLLVRQGCPSVDLYTRAADGWLVRWWRGLEETCEIASIGVRLPLADVYDRVTFPPADE